MTRSSCAVRRAVPADVPAVLELWKALRETGGRSPRAGGAVPAEEVSDRLASMVEETGSRILVAESGEAVIGMLIMSSTSLGELLDVPAVQISHLVVAPGHRRRGVGRALLAAAAAWAEEVGADNVVVNVYPSLREANRFYARLGFAPLVVRRVSGTTALRRRLAALDGRVRPGLPATLVRRRHLGAVGLRRSRPVVCGDDETETEELTLAPPQPAASPEQDVQDLQDVSVSRTGPLVIGIEPELPVEPA